MIRANILTWGRPFGPWWNVAAVVAFFATVFQGPVRAEDRASLNWEPAQGAILKTSIGTVFLDRNDRLRAPVLKFASGGEVSLTEPQVTQANTAELKLAYGVTAPNGTALRVVRELKLASRESETDLVEVFQITPSKPLTADVEIERPFAIKHTGTASGPSAVCPLFNGWAKSYPLSDQSLEVEYKLGNWLGGNQIERLALPVIQLDAQGVWRAAISSDCRFSSLFNVSAADATVQGSIRYRYACSKVALEGAETRTFGVWLAPPPAAGEPFGKSIDSFFRLMLPDVPPGPRWQHDIAMVSYDYLSDSGQGWEKDIAELARLLTPEERARVAMCLHGWYDSLGGYCYDDTTGKLRTEWVAMARTRKVHFTQQELKRRLQAAKQRGFRVLLYFADGMAQDSAAPVAGCYHADWNYRDSEGKLITGWQGPDTWGPTYMRNPAHPAVFKWYQDYLHALLTTYGPDLDGFVWDETFHARLGQIAREPRPAYCDRAMMDLIKALRQQVMAFDAEKVFLASDCADLPGAANYAMMADGTYQDVGCRPSGWSYGFFPNWQNTQWGCCWSPLARFADIRWGTEKQGTAVAISNGWGDDKGPSEWEPAYRDAVVSLFRKRLTKVPVRFLTEDPANVLATLIDPPAPSDPIPNPAADEKNWALAANGATATASSEYDVHGARCGPAGLIDGLRDDTRWCNGHGWCSGHGQPLPQWVEIVFPQPRSVSRFIIFNYTAKADPRLVNVWGVKNYDIEAWDASSNSWKAVVSENTGRVVTTRVHVLDKAFETTKFRVVVKAVVPVDGLARLLQVEAWGKQ